MKGFQLRYVYLFIFSFFYIFMGLRLEESKKTQEDLWTYFEAQYF